MRAVALRRADRHGAWLVLPVSLSTLLSAMTLAGPPPMAADHTATPASVTLVGNLQSELGCAGDWDPSCAAAGLVSYVTDEAWQEPTGGGQ